MAQAVSRSRMSDSVTVTAEVSKILMEQGLAATVDRRPSVWTPHLKVSARKQRKPY
jgi:hypothetical protein